VQFRPPTAEDGQAVIEVITARDLADIGVPDYTVDDLRDEWAATELDLANDAVVVEDDRGVIVAYGSVRRPGTYALVAPDHEGRGIGARLLEWAERREREQGRTCHRQWIAAANQTAAALLRERGYEHVRSYWRMARALDPSLEAGPPPVPGVTIRSLDVERDGAALHALDAASFSANPDYVPESLEAFCEEHLAAHDLDPDLSCVAQDGDRIAGFALSRRWRETATGFVEILAVHPDYQRRGIGSVLLRTAFARYARAGLRDAQLGVASDNPRALRLYERAGMTPRFQFDTYERSILD
jgi:mycothiol synthase